jgi:hypothetical protein
MRKVILIFLVITISFSCQKIKENDLCDSEICKTYINIWKELFITKNQLTEEYFNEHIFPYSTSIDTWNDGKSFCVEYKVKIDWAEADLYDKFIIWLNPSTSGLYPSYPLPRSAYLTKNQINTVIDILGFGSGIYTVSMVEHINYTSREDAIQVLKTVSGIDNLNNGEIFYQRPGLHVSLGHPFLRINATINMTENKCIECKLDLVSEETEVIQQACITY